MSKELAFHPIADLFPLMEGEEFEELVRDVKANGLHEPIVIYEDKILDGRNRYRACLMAEVEPTFRPFDGDDPVNYVVSLNLRRRHLNESQRAMVAARLATLRRGDNQHAQICAPSQSDAADMLNVGRRSVQYAREVQEQGAPELIKAVERGEVSISTAADVASLTEEEQQNIVARGPREILEAAKAIRNARAAQKRAEWTQRAIELSNQNAPLPEDRRYPVILADPPWAFEVYDETSGFDSAAAAHYPTMSTEAICAMPVANITTPDTVLFLWTPASHLPEALEVMKAWGFEYKTHMVWDKERAGGLGYWVRNQHELLLIGARGDMRSPESDGRSPSIIRSPRREHSRKPDEAYEAIERMYPDLPRIELFARQAREGWTAWGNEIEGSGTMEAAAA
jgi:N6-adenosine-specific RNA methylase IME4/ParB-like chromosome segregation protein Spo0J